MKEEAEATEAPEGEAEGRTEEPAETEGRGEGAEEDQSLTELLKQLGRELGELGITEAQLEAARNLPEVRRAARDVAGLVVVVVAGFTAFAFVNVAALVGLSKVMATWFAAVVLAAVWLVIGGVLLFGVMGRARRWLAWIVLKAPPSEAVEGLEQERDAAGQAALGTLERIGPALVTQIALAAMPKAGDVAEDVAGGVIEVGGTVLEASEEIVEVIPGGGVVSQVWDVALRPGRLGVKVATTVLRRGRPAS